MKKTFSTPIFLILAVLTVIPMRAFAVDLNLNTASFKIVVCYIIGIIGQIIPILYFLAFILFFWGLSKFVLMAGNEKELQTGKNYMLWGILALFILLSVNAIVTMVTGEFFDKTQVNGYPYLPGTTTAGVGCDLKTNTTSGIVTDPVQ